MVVLLEKSLRYTGVERAIAMQLIARHVAPGYLPQREEEPVRDVRDRPESEMGPTRALHEQTGRGTSEPAARTVSITTSVLHEGAGLSVRSIRVSTPDGQQR